MEETIIDQANEPVDLPTERNYLVSVGRINKSKNQILTIKAYEQSILSSKWDLVFVGDGPHLNDLRQYAEAKSLLKKVHFLGFRKNPFPFVKAAQAFVSASNWEGFPNAHIEALKVGIPVISSDCLTGPKEIVRHGQNGLLFEMNNRDALIDIFDTIAENPVILDKYRRNARQSVAHLAINHIVQQWREQVVE